jgi:thiol:disulfide interchange protein
MDKRAATIAGLSAAIISLLAGMGVLQYLHENALGLPRLLATVVLGRGAFDAEQTSNAMALGVGTAVHLGLGLVFAFVISFTLHRWGFWVGLIGGGLFGLALYAINTYTMSRFFPEFYFYRSWFMVGLHVVFGALCGGIYESLERDHRSDRSIYRY